MIVGTAPSTDLAARDVACGGTRGAHAVARLRRPEVEGLHASRVGVGRRRRDRSVHAERCRVERVDGGGLHVDGALTSSGRAVQVAAEVRRGSKLRLGAHGVGLEVDLEELVVELLLEAATNVDAVGRLAEGERELVLVELTQNPRRARALVGARRRGRCVRTSRRESSVERGDRRGALAAWRSPGRARAAADGLLGLTPRKYLFEVVARC